MDKDAPAGSGFSYATTSEGNYNSDTKSAQDISNFLKEVGNFRVEPPGLFRGRGELPKMVKLKKHVRPSDITINIGRDAPVPECPIPGESWKEIRHDNAVTWLAFWNDPINSKEFNYVFLAASSSLKGQSDKEKYDLWDKACGLTYTQEQIDEVRDELTVNMLDECMYFGRTRLFCTCLGSSLSLWIVWFYFVDACNQIHNSI